MTHIRTISRTSREEIRVSILPADDRHELVIDARVFAPNRGVLRPDDLASTSRALTMRPNVAEAVAAALIEAARVARSGPLGPRPGRSAELVGDLVVASDQPIVRHVGAR